MDSTVSIFIVENERITAEDISQRVRMLGYRVSGVSGTGEAALKAIEKDPPDLVLMDIRLDRKMTGIEAAGLIRKRHHIPVIYITAYSDPETLEKLKLTEPFGFLTKPFFDNELHGVIETALYRHAMETRLRESELRFSRLAEASFEGIGVFAQGTLIDANDQLSRMFGYSPDEILGTNGLRLVAPKSRNLVMEHLRAGFEGPYEHMAIRKDGSVFPIEVQGKAISHEGRTVGVVAVRDITERKRSERTLLKSEEKFSKIFRTSPAPIVIVRLKDSRIVEVNQAFENLSGYRREEIIGRTARELKLSMNSREHDLVFRNLRQAGRAATRESRFRTKGGDVKTCRFSFEKIELDGESCVLMVLLDLTERERIEATLRESENKFRTIIEQAGDGIALVDEKGIIIEWNAAQERIWGRRRDEVLGTPFTKIQFQATLPGRGDRDRLKLYKNALSEALSRGTAWIFDRPLEATIVRPDGKRRDILQSVFPIPTQSGYRIGSVTSDITERKQAEDALKESEEQYRYIVEHSSDGFVIVINGTIVFANSKVTEITKYPLNRIIDAPFEKFLAPEEAPGVIDRYRRRIAGEKLPSVYETKVMSKDGNRIEVEFYIELIHYRGELATFVMIRNITERKRIQEAIEKARQALHLASFGTLAAGIAHEINQPLTALKVKVDGLLYWSVKKPAVLQKDMLQHLRFISEQADKIDQIIRHMRSLIRHEKLRTSPVDVNETVRKACSFLRQQLASHGITLKLKLSRSVPLVIANPTSLEQVVINLVQNAMKALDRTDSKDKTIAVSTRTLRAKCIMDVSDNGPGILPAHMARIFDPLFTTEKDGAGMGLGLSIVQRFINDMGGSIRVRNKPDKGVVFSILIPLAVA
jgi:two-component system, cell cycle sensor histidine kinase and response regulator CckA